MDKRIKIRKKNFKIKADEKVKLLCFIIHIWITFSCLPIYSQGKFHFYLQALSLHKNLMIFLYFTTNFAFSQGILLYSFVFISKNCCIFLMWISIFLDFPELQNKNSLYLWNEMKLAFYSCCSLLRLWSWIKLLIWNFQFNVLYLLTIRSFPFKFPGIHFIVVCLVKLTIDIPIPLQWLHIFKLTNIKSQQPT